MKLLIMTQAVDRAHPILGFFHRWLEEFGKDCENVSVIGQQVGDHELPGNVRVYSLGKEKGVSRLGQIFRFWKLIWTAPHYDAVLVHMTPVWVLLGAPVWIVRRKPIYLWYEVRRGGWVLKSALWFVKNVFSATVHGLPSPSSKQKVLGHGIDTVLFHMPETERNQQDLLAVGRITKIKRLETILQAFAALPPDYRLTIVGPMMTEDDHAYRALLEQWIAKRGISSRVTWSVLDQQGMALAMQSTGMLLHAAGGGLDKVLLEAMSSGCPIVSCSEAAVDVLPPACVCTVETMPETVAKAIADHTLDDPALLSSMRETIEQHHSLPTLISKMVSQMSQRVS